MARYKLTLAYDGTHFAGSQRQQGRRTVQGELEEALRRLGWNGHSILLAGRTDSGVHAWGQVATFDWEWSHSLHALQQALNANLPPDMVVRRVEMVPADFHPRYDATARCYRYRLFLQPLRDPFRERYAWRVWPELDGEQLHALARLWLDRHDFRAFGSPPRAEGHTVRTVFSATWQNSDDEWHFQIEADAFLYRMVRRLVYVQVAVAQGRYSPFQVKQALEEGSALPAGLAPPQGLMLMEVKYSIDTP